MNEIIFFIDNFIFSENELYSFSFLFITILFIINLFIFIYKLFNGIKFNKYISGFEKDFFSGKYDMFQLNKLSEEIKSVSLIAFIYSEGFKTFYSIYKVNPKFQISSAIDLTKNKMNSILFRHFIYENRIVGLIYLSSILTLFFSFFMSIWTLIDILIIIENDSPIEIFIYPLITLVFLLILSFFNYLFYLILEELNENSINKSKAFIFDFTNYLHKNFFDKEVDNES